jgi:hypothetical protein
LWFCAHHSTELWQATLEETPAPLKITRARASSVKRVKAWPPSIFNHDYQLADKPEVERRVKTILQKQPTYKFIYKNAHER